MKAVLAQLARVDLMASRLKFDDIKTNIEKNGWHLISEEYTNLKTDLQVECPEGHDCFVSYDKWRRGFECPVCKKNKYYKTDNIAVKKTGYRILAFDQASITSGWAVFDNDQLVKYGKWTSEGTHSTERIAKTKYWFISMVENWKPDQVILEDIQLQKFGENGEAVLTFKKLAHLQGVLKNYCYENQIPYSIVPSTTWRAFSEIKGRARQDKKKNAQLKVKRFYDISVTQDEADAILIGRWGAHQHKSSEIIEF